MSEWLDALETAVRRATSEVARLRDQNERLVARAAELEHRLEEAELRVLELGEAAEAHPAVAPDSSAWDAEKGEIRARVENLTARIESLLGELGPGA